MNTIYTLFGLMIIVYGTPMYLLHRATKRIGKPQKAKVVKFSNEVEKKLHMDLETIRECLVNE